MANVSMTLPYLFLTIAFPFFKAKAHLDRPFVIFKNRQSTLLATGVVLLVVTFANIFTIIQPVIDGGDWGAYAVDGRRADLFLTAGVGDLRTLPSAHGVRRAGNGELKSLPGGVAGQSITYRLPAVRRLVFLPRSWSYCFACRRYFPDASARLEGTAYQCHARGSRRIS